MFHSDSLNGLAAAQYISCLVVGALYFVVFGAMAGVAAGLSLVGLGPVFVPLVLGGYASGLSLIMPRVAAVLAITCSVPYLLLGFLGYFRGTILLFVIPSAVVISISIVALLWSDGSVWRRLTTTFEKITIGIILTLPVLFATWWLGSFTSGLLSAHLRFAK